MRHKERQAIKEERKNILRQRLHKERQIDTPRRRKHMKNKYKQQKQRRQKQRKKDR